MRIDGHLLTATGFVRGHVRIGADGRCAAVDGVAVDEHEVRGSALPIVLPGFIDTHLHGGAGHDVMDAGDAALHIARLHARHGTTAWLATTMTAPTADIEAALRALAPSIAVRPAGAARCLGVHLEGPYISARRLGAQPDFTRPAHVEEILAFHALAPLVLVTLAPEPAGQAELIAALVAAGLRVQLGHSGASYEDGVAALAAGASGFTHLYNAMSALHHREPGLVGAALAHATHAELIPDLHHVHPGAIRAALRCIPGLYCVSDATSATGMPDGEYGLGRQRVFKCLGAVRLADGTLAGSTLTLDQALRNLVSIGLTLAEASRRTATHAADRLGLADRGRLAVGAWGDLVVLNPDLAVQRVVVEGEEIELA